MTSSKSKCIIILSTKSSGSSALQNLLVMSQKARHLDKTRHSEHESLYWTKAASVLGLPQLDMLDSEVPIPRDKAKQDLLDLLGDNLGEHAVPTEAEALVFDGWRQLCLKYAPVFIEKSPHHLHQWSAIELILQGKRRLPEVELLIVGLVRNPLDALHSMWRRWRYVPEAHQYEWLTAYRNLLELKRILKDELLLVRYEDMVTDVSCLAPIYSFIGASPSDADCGYLNQSSVGRWKADQRFGFSPARSVIDTACRFGYAERDLVNPRRGIWPLYRTLSRVAYRSLAPLRAALTRQQRHDAAE